MLKEAEFSILYLLKEDALKSQRQIAEKLEMSLGKVNLLVQQLQEQELLNGYTVTEKALMALEPYKVDNAIIMAAGMSGSLAPLSYEVPKGLLKVRGEILIERQIRQLKQAGIEKITVVIGYMKEKFFYLADEFGVELVINEDYYRYHNTSTLMRVKEKLSNTYICSCDDYFMENPFTPYVYRSYYAGVYTEGKTEEYCMQCDHSGKIKEITVGGCNTWYMLGHAYFDREFSEKFVSVLEKEYEKTSVRESLWESLLADHLKELPIRLSKYPEGVIFEFDSVSELRTFDPTYVDNIDSSIMDNICRSLSCQKKDIVDIEAIKAGLTNMSFRFTVNNEQYVYRHPGIGTEEYIDRDGEAEAMQAAASLGLDDTFICMDEVKGWKLSRFITNARELDYRNDVQVKKALTIMRTLHDANRHSSHDFGIWNKTEDFIETLRKAGRIQFEGFEELYQTLKKVQSKVDGDAFSRKCLCHNDCYSPNFLLDEADKMYLIDWEYSGNDDPASDLGTFICCSDYDFNESVEIIRLYLGREADDTEMAHYMGYVAIASYYWYVWALYQEYRGNNVGEWLLIWYQNSRKFAEKTLELLMK